MSRRQLGLDEARTEAAACIGSLPRRWAHVQAVGAVAERLVGEQRRLNDNLSLAAWLHDIGYGPKVARTGFHPLDGARYLSEGGWPAEVVRLVAHHTGARFEAEERGLSNELNQFPEPDDKLAQDTLCLIDLTTGPDGDRVTVDQRLAEILSRYRPEDPVHRAISRSGAPVRAAASRAARELESTDEWFRAAAESVFNS